MASGLAVVTGAASGIGRATAVRLASEGWTVTLLDRDAERLAATAEDVRAGSRGDAVRDLLVVDLSNAAGTDTVAGEYLRTRDIDLLVNNAGVGFRATAEETSDEQWNTTLAVNLSAMFLLCRAVLPGMIRRGHGVIVNTASAGGLVGLRNLGRVLRVEGRGDRPDPGARGRSCRAGDPGQLHRAGIDTEWLDRMLADDPDPVATRTMMENRQLDGRLGTPEEVAAGIAFMAGPDGRFFNGSVMVMDAGLTAV